MLNMSMNSLPAFCPPGSDNNSFQSLFAFEIKPMLYKVNNTAPDRDNTSYWLFRYCLYKVAEIESDIYNCTLRFGIVLSQ